MIRTGQGRHREEALGGSWPGHAKGPREQRLQAAAVTLADEATGEGDPGDVDRRGRCVQTHGRQRGAEALGSQAGGRRRVGAYAGQAQVSSCRTTPARGLMQLPGWPGTYRCAEVAAARATLVLHHPAPVVFTQHQERGLAGWAHQLVLDHTVCAPAQLQPDKSRSAGAASSQQPCPVAGGQGRNQRWGGGPQVATGPHQENVLGGLHGLDIEGTQDTRWATQPGWAEGQKGQRCSGRPVQNRPGTRPGSPAVSQAPPDMGDAPTATVTPTPRVTTSPG